MLKRGAKLILPLLMVVFLAGLGRFLYLRFSSGEIYPAYSTFRPDPVGAKALYESLKRLDEIDTSRQLEGLHRARPGPSSTYLFLGLPRPRFYIEDDEFTGLARAGARVILAFDSRSSISEQREKDRINSLRKRGPTNAPPLQTGVNVPILAGLQLQLIDPLALDNEMFEANSMVEGAADLPWAVPWYGHYWIQTPTNTNWETVYAVKDKPVVLQQKVGLGTILLLADSFLFSNEALATERSPEFLLWVFGKARNIIFDETHLGVQSGSSLAVILREYRMHGLIVGLFLLGGLWIWKNSSPFVPAYTQENAHFADNSVAGKTTREGILHLLQRNIPLPEVPVVCVKEWAKANAGADAAKLARLKEVEPILEGYNSLAPKDKNPFETYQIITEILSAKKNK